MVPDDHYLSRMRKGNSGKGSGGGLGHKGSAERRQQRSCVAWADAVTRLGGGSKVVRSWWEQGGKKKIKCVIKLWNVRAYGAWEIRVSYGSKSSDWEGAERTHPGNVTKLAAVSFLVGYKQAMETRYVKGRSCEGSRCKMENSTWWHEVWQSALSDVML